MRRRKNKPQVTHLDTYDVGCLLKALTALNKIEHDTNVAVVHGSLLVGNACIPTFYNAPTESYVIEWNR